MAVTTKKLFSATTNATTTVFSPVGIQLNNQDDLDVYVTLSGGTRVLQLRQSTGSTAQSSHPQVNNTDGLYFPAVSAGTTLYNYTLSTDNNTITFNSALPQGAVVFCERRTRDADSSYTSFATGSTIRATDLNNSSTESNFTAQDGRNKALTMEGVLFRGDQPSTNFVTTDHIVAGTIVTNDIANDSVNADKIADDTINSEHYVDASIDTQHIALENITTALIAGDAIVSSKLADNAVDSEHYVDGSIDHVHLANDAVDGDNIADNSINSEHYVNGSIDTAHIAADQITNALIADNQIDSEHYVDGSVDHVHLANDCIDGDNIQDDVVNSEHIAAGALDNEHYAAGSITSDKLSNATVVTASEQAAAASNDTSFLTTAAADARFFNVSTGDTIKDGDSFPDNDTTIATTAAINDRIIDLVDDVGGFVAVANESSFPNANPDVNNGTGTIVSISALSSSHSSDSSGNFVITNGTVGNSNVTITGNTANTTYSAGFGLLVETTTTLNTYTFHRLVPKATEVTTVAGKATEIGRLGTAAAVEDMSILGTADVVADLNTLGTADVVSDLNTLGTADVVADMNTLAVTSVVNNMDTVATNVANVNNVGGSISNVNTTAGSIANVNTVAGSIANVNTTAGSISNVNSVAGSIANVNTTASNIGNVNNFAATYQIASSAPSTDGAGNALAAGDLYFDTSANELRVHNGTAFQGGVTATGNLAGTGANTFTGNQTIQNTSPELFFTDTNANSDYSIHIENGSFHIMDKTNNAGRFKIESNGNTTAHGNLNCDAGLDVTGNITVTGNVDGRDVAADGVKLDGIESNAKDDQTAGEIKTLLNSNALTNAQIDASAAIDGSKITPSFTGNISVTNVAPKIFLTDSDTDSDFAIRNMHGVFGIHDQTNSVDRLTVASDGQFTVNTNNNGANFKFINNTHNAKFHLISTGSNKNSQIFFGDTADDSIGSIDYDHFDNSLLFKVNGSTSMTIANNGQVDFAGNVDCNAGLDVTGDITATGNITANGDIFVSSAYPRIHLTDTDNNSDYLFVNDNGNFRIFDVTNNTARFTVEGNGTTIVAGNLDCSSGVDVTGNITVSGTVDGRDVATDGTKLDGIEASATADQTASEILTLIKTVDGSGSGLDADTLDGISSASFLRSDADDTTTGNLTISNSAPKINFTDTNADSDFQLKGNAGKFEIIDTTNNAERFRVNSDGHIDVEGNLDVGAGIDVTGRLDVNGDYAYLQSSSTSTSSITFKKSAANADSIDYIQCRDSSNALKFKIGGSGNAEFASNIVVSGTVDGVDIAARDTLFGGLTASSGVLTDGVTATTQTQSNNSAQVATTAYVRTAISNVNATPANGSITTAKLADDAVDGDKVSANVNQSRAKCWCAFNGEGSIQTFDQYNVGALEDTGTGKYKITFSTNMSNDNFAVVTNQRLDTSGGAPNIVHTGVERDDCTSATVGIRCGTGNQNAAGGSGSFVDVSCVYIAVFGDGGKL